MQQLLSGLGGLSSLGGLAKPPASAKQISQMPFKSFVGVTDGDDAYNTVAKIVAIVDPLIAGSPWTKIWEMTVPAQQKIRWGFGSPALPHNQGYMWAVIGMTVTVDFEVGVLRLVQANARETRLLTVAESDDSRLHAADVATLITATPVNINEMMALPEKVEFPLVGEDSKLQLYYRCITATAGAMTAGALGFSIPITVYQ